MGRGKTRNGTEENQQHTKAWTCNAFHRQSVPPAHILLPSVSAHSRILLVMSSSPESYSAAVPTLRRQGPGGALPLVCLDYMHVA